MKYLKQTVINFSFLCLFWAGMVQGLPGIDNIATFVAWALCAVWSLAAFAGPTAETSVHPVMVGFNRATQAALLGMMVWTGHFVMGGLFLLSWSVYKARQQSDKKAPE